MEGLSSLRPSKGSKKDLDIIGESLESKTKRRHDVQREDREKI